MQYVEFASSNLSRIKDFYRAAFDWSFTDYGESYTAFSGTFVDGGFYAGQPKRGSVMVILYSENLAASLQAVKDAGGTIDKDVYEFPGGKRFEFSDPDGNAMAVWSLV